MKQAQAVAEANRGMAIVLTFLIRVVLSFAAEALTAMVSLQVSFASTVQMVVATATIRSVRSWSHFNVNIR